MEVVVLFRWRDEYSVKVKVIDEQHKNLFRIGRKLYDILSSLTLKKKKKLVTHWKQSDTSFNY